MPLKLRPTGLGSGIDKDRTDYTVFCGEWNIGRIYERHGFPADVLFFWSLHGVVLTRAPDIHTDGHEPTLEMAKARLKRSWDRWLEWSERVEAEMTRLEQRGAVAFAVVIFIALVIAVWGLF